MLKDMVILMNESKQKFVLIQSQIFINEYVFILIQPSLLKFGSFKNAFNEYETTKTLSDNIFADYVKPHLINSVLPIYNLNSNTMIDSLKPTKPIISFSSQSHRAITLEFQLKMIQLYGPSLGIYALPSLSDHTTWNCIIFVRRGFYKDGKFKFIIKMQDFPIRQPKIIFNSKIFHPLIKQNTGELDVSSVLSQPWNYGQQNMLFNLMKDLTKIFTDRKRLTNKFSSNPHAANLLETNLHEFLTKALTSVNDSEQKYQQNDPQSPYYICEASQQTQSIKHMLSQVVSDKTKKFQQKRNDFIKRLLEIRS